MSKESLLAQLDEELAPSWRAEADLDLIAGRVVRLGSHTTDYGAYPVITVTVDSATSNGKKCPEDTLAIHMMGTVLQNAVKRLAEEGTPIAPGGEIAVRYNGTKPSKTAGNNPYKDWSVAYESPSIADKLDAPAGGGGAMFD